MIPGEVTHIRIDAATKQGIQALALAGHRSFGAEARWALSWWVENKKNVVIGLDGPDSPTIQDFRSLIGAPVSLTMPGTFIKVQQDEGSG